MNAVESQSVGIIEDERPLVEAWEWIIWYIWRQKGVIAAHLLLHQGTDHQNDPFFTLDAVSTESGRESLRLSWAEKARDVELFLEAVADIVQSCDPQTPKEQRLSELDFAQQNTLLGWRQLEETSLFKAMSSTRILVTSDQADEFGRPITPAAHVDRVRLYSAENESGSVDFARLQLSHTDEVIRRLLILLHDIGKMAGINFMVLAYSQEDARSEFEQAYRYQTQEGKLKTHGKHSHPKHAWIGAVIVRELLTTVTRDYYTSPAGKFFASNRDQAVLIGAIFHHHDLIYRGEADQSQLTSWLFQELNAIRKTTIDHDPLLVVKILQQIVMLRFADTAATPAHRKHWEKNVAWLKLVPDILRQELAKETNSFKERGWFDLRAGLTSDPDLNESNYIEQVETSSNRIKTEIDLLERIIENYPSSHPEH